MAVKMNKWNSIKYPDTYHDTPIRRAWINMKTRCDNLNTADYKNYGGRGITYVERWKQFANFLEDMEATHFEGSTLDRADNSKGYSPENCRWVTRKVQNNNKRNNRFFEFDGKSQTLPQWAKELGINRSTLSMRYYKYNWSLDRLFLRKVG